MRNPIKLLMLALIINLSGWSLLGYGIWSWVG